MRYFPPQIYNLNAYEVYLQLEHLEALRDTGISALNGGGNQHFLNSHIRNVNIQKVPLFILKIIILT